MTALGCVFLSSLKVTHSYVWLLVHESLRQSDTFSVLEAEVPADEGFSKHTSGVADLPVGIVPLFKGWIVPVPAPT